jgi:hypothetical protein
LLQRLSGQTVAAGAIAPAAKFYLLKRVLASVTHLALASLAKASHFSMAVL